MKIEERLSKAELYDLIDGFWAWDEGCTDSGIFDTVRREQLKDYLLRLAIDGRTMHQLVSRRYFDFIFDFIKLQMFEKPDCGLEDMAGFLHWLKELTGIEMGKSI